MKILYSLFFVLMGGLMQAQDTSGNITYKVTTTPEFEKNIDSVLNAVEDKMLADLVRKQKQKEKNVLPYLVFNLRFNKNNSLFDFQKGLANDNGLDLEEIAGSAGVVGEYFIDLKEGYVLCQIEDGEIYRVQTDLDSLDWKISKETKTIQGYTCQKATAVAPLNHVKKGKIIAWFTTELPFQYGPLEFGGLPGMILGLERNNYYFYADEIKLHRKEYSIKKPSKGKLISQTEYFQIVRDWEKSQGLN